MNKEIRGINHCSLQIRRGVKLSHDSPGILPTGRLRSVQIAVLGNSVFFCFLNKGRMWLFHVGETVANSNFNFSSYWNFQGTKYLAAQWDRLHDVLVENDFSSANRTFCSMMKQDKTLCVLDLELSSLALLVARNSFWPLIRSTAKFLARKTRENRLYSLLPKNLSATKEQLNYSRRDMLILFSNNYEWIIL